MENYETQKALKIKKIEEDQKLKELEDYFGKYQQEKIKRCLEREQLPEEQRQLIFERQWKDKERRDQLKKETEQKRRMEEQKQLEQLFKPRL